MLAKSCVLCVFSHDGDRDDHGVRRADTAQAHTRWQHIVASHEANDTRYAPSGDVPRAVSPRRHGCRNRRRNRYIVYNRVANKSINSLKVNGFN